MSSTYSPSLRLELMATGDQSGTWGDTTNTNLGTLLEQAITGVLSVAEGDTTLTLTTNDGASDQARNAVINLTGAMTGPHNVIVQTANKVYLIKNSTTGGFNITAKTAAGTGVEIAPGTARWVYADGTNVVDALPGLSYGYATTATAAGTTTLTVGSAYQQFFTGSTTQTVVLPVASTLTLGQSWLFFNNSSGVVTIQSSGANTVLAMAAGTAARITCILTSGTSASSWNVSNYSPNGSGSTTGSGAYVLQTSPTLITPTLGVASATSINKVAITAPATGSTLTIADGKTLTASNTLTLAGTDSTTMTFPSSSAAVAALNLASQTITGGAIVTSNALGTVSSGTTTLNPGTRPMWDYTNGGAHTLAPGTNKGTIVLDITNNASAGTITTSGWTKVTGVFDTTNGHVFRCMCSIGAGGSLLQIQAMF